MKRFRFSLRWVLVAIAIFAVMLYVCVVRPTILANRFVTAVNAQDMGVVEALVAENDRRETTYIGVTRDPATHVDHIYADLFPRGWSDWLGCRRRIVLRIARHQDANGRHVEWTEDIDIVARITGVEIWPSEHYFY